VSSGNTLSSAVLPPFPFFPIGPSFPKAPFSNFFAGKNHSFGVFLVEFPISCLSPGTVFYRGYDVGLVIHFLLGGPVFFFQPSFFFPPPFIFFLFPREIGFFLLACCVVQMVFFFRILSLSSFVVGESFHFLRIFPLPRGKTFFTLFRSRVAPPSPQNFPFPP